MLIGTHIGLSLDGFVATPDGLPTSEAVPRFVLTRRRRRTKLVSFNMMTLNGFFEGPDPWSLDWRNTDEEFQAFAVEQLNSIGTLLIGRATYQGMAACWPTPAALKLLDHA